jgi:hypothetical protein
LEHFENQLAVCQNLVPLVKSKIAGQWMFIPLKMVLIGIDPYPAIGSSLVHLWFIFPPPGLPIGKVPSPSWIGRRHLKGSIKELENKG